MSLEIVTNDGYENEIFLLGKDGVRIIGAYAVLSKGVILYRHINVGVRFLLGNIKNNKIRYTFHELLRVAGKKEFTTRQQGVLYVLERRSLGIVDMFNDKVIAA